MENKKKIKFLIDKKNSIFCRFMREEYPNFSFKIKNNLYFNNNWYVDIRNYPYSIGISDSDIINKWSYLISKLTYNINFNVIYTFIKDNNLCNHLLNNVCMNEKYYSLTDLINSYLKNHYRIPSNFFFHTLTWINTNEGDAFWSDIHHRFSQYYVNQYKIILYDS